MSACNISFVDIFLLPFDIFWGYAAFLAELVQRLSAALHGTLGSYLRDDLHEGSAEDVACLPLPRA
jgi:hypothetical protein